MTEANIKLPKQLMFLLDEKARYKVAYGGRGGAKSHSFARALILKSLEGKKRILCTRDFQNSMADSVHKLLDDLISEYSLDAYFTVTKTNIVSCTGSEFIFKGLERSIKEIKSLEAIDICWVEEAAKTSAKSWDILLPTIRKEGSEIWISFNPDENRDFTYQEFVVNERPDSIVRKINYYDNPWLPEPIKDQATYDRTHNMDRYDHVWLGNPKKRNDAQIFKDKWEVKEFDTPDLHEMQNERFYYGADWGFAVDPTVLVRCFVQDNCLYIDYEAYGVGVEMNQLSQLFVSIPESRKWPIIADSARPETISYLGQEYDQGTDEKGFNIVGAEKWKGSVEDGIEYLRSFKKIYIHPRCKHAIEEFQYYSYKVDKVTGEILPVVVDAHNHIVDALRYSLSGYIKQYDDPVYDESVNRNTLNSELVW
jgi:phage terminase large subunit